jgi:hypothetical protein
MSQLNTKAARGEFCVNGEWVPNQLTGQGIQNIFGMALGDVLHEQMQIGLCTGPLIPAFSKVSDPTLLTVPTVGVNGYAQPTIDKGALSWAAYGFVDSEVFVETTLFTFTASGGSFSSPVNRLFLSNGIGALIYKLFAYSQPFVDTPMTIVNGQILRVKYRIWFR